MTAENLQSLSELIRQYPFFQSARALQLKGLKSQSSFLYNDALKTTAAHTTDRTILFEYITSEEFSQHEISREIIRNEASVNDLPVISENVSEQTGREINEQIKAELKKAEAILNPNLFEKKTATAEDLHENTAEELQLGKPLEFKPTDKHSFSEWLQLTKLKPIQRETENQATEGHASQKRRNQLIEKFILEQPKISPTLINPKEIPPAPSYPPTPDSLMTETLARVYLQQKNYKKAVQAYKILILRNPEKSGFFADQIRAIEKLTNSQQ